MRRSSVGRSTLLTLITGLGVGFHFSLQTRLAGSSAWFLSGAVFCWSRGPHGIPLSSMVEQAELSSPDRGTCTGRPGYISLDDTETVGFQATQEAVLVMGRGRSKAAWLVNGLESCLRHRSGRCPRDSPALLGRRPGQRSRTARRASECAPSRTSTKYTPLGSPTPPSFSRPSPAPVVPANTRDPWPACALDVPPGRESGPIRDR